MIWFYLRWKMEERKSAKAIESEKEKERKKTEAKESLDTGHAVSDVCNGLDLLQNNRKH